jgi:hypothetical protein
MEVAADVARSIEFAERSALPDPTDVYQNMYVNPINYPANSGGVRQ